MIRVVVTYETGREPLQDETIEDDYILVVEGSCYLSSVQTYPNGTHVLVIKGRKAKESAS
jgi:hypothetical protein